jgi:hypothetical protein
MSVFGQSGRNSAKYQSEKELREFGRKLAMAQQPLGKEFDKVLYDNLWDLYIESHSSLETETYIEK